MKAELDRESPQAALAVADDPAVGADRSPRREAEPATTAGASVPHPRAVAQAAALVGRRLRHVIAAPGRLVGIVMNPLVMLFSIGYLFVNALRSPVGGASYVDFLAAGVAAQACLAGVGPTAVAVRLDLDRGFMDRLRSLPVRRGVVHVAHSLADLVIALGAVLIVLALSAAMGWRPAPDAGGLATGCAVLLLFAYMTVWLGMALGTVVRNAESVDAVAALVLVVLTFLSSALLSPSAFPAWLRPVVEWNPVSAVATSVRISWHDPVPASAGFAGEHATLVAVLWSLVLLAGSVVVTRVSARTR